MHRIRRPFHYEKTFYQYKLVKGLSLIIKMISNVIFVIVITEKTNKLREIFTWYGRSPSITDVLW